VNLLVIGVSDIPSMVVVIFCKSVRIAAYLFPHPSLYMRLAWLVIPLYISFQDEAFSTGPTLSLPRVTLTGLISTLLMFSGCSQDKSDL
jgi:hypothetical protein